VEQSHLLVATLFTHLLLAGHCQVKHHHRLIFLLLLAVVVAEEGVVVEVEQEVIELLREHLAVVVQRNLH
jgi:hypothetical protein